MVKLTGWWLHYSSVMQYSQYSNLWVEVAEFGYPVPLCAGLDLERRRFELLLGRF